MKKVIGLTAIVAMLLISCKRDYRCTCYDHFDNEISTEEFEAKNLEEAQGQCGNDINYGTTSRCDLEEIM